MTALTRVQSRLKSQGCVKGTAVIVYFDLTRHLHLGEMPCVFFSQFVLLLEDEKSMIRSNKTNTDSVVESLCYAFFVSSARHKTSHTLYEFLLSLSQERNRERSLVFRPQKKTSNCNEKYRIVPIILSNTTPL